MQLEETAGGGRSMIVSDTETLSVDERWLGKLECGRQMTVKTHFDGKNPAVRKIYGRLLASARALGPVVEEPKKTSIHLMRHTTFAGVAARRSSLILTLKSAKDIRSPRIGKREQTSAHRWHLEIRLETPTDVDRELTMWLSAAYELAAAPQPPRG